MKKSTRVTLTVADIQLIHYALDILECDHPDDNDQHRNVREESNKLRLKIKLPFEASDFIETKSKIVFLR